MLTVMWERPLQQISTGVQLTARADQRPTTVSGAHLIN